MGKAYWRGNSVDFVQMLDGDGPVAPTYTWERSGATLPTVILGDPDSPPGVL